MTIAQLIKHLEQYNPDDVIAYDLWTVDDVLHEGNHHDDYPDVTQEQAEEVLGRMERHKDATIGMNWDVLNYHLDEVMSKP
jgi:hypothetical protein